MTSVHLIHAGYTGEHVGSTVVLVRDGDATIVVDPGMVARRSLILDPLAALGVAPEAVTHVFLSHHHPDHTINCALFPEAEVVDFWARYLNDLWLDHDGDGYRLSPKSQLWLTPGHSEEDASLVVEADDGVYVMTHLWWHTDRTRSSTRSPRTRRRSSAGGPASWPPPTWSSRVTAPRSASAVRADAPPTPFGDRVSRREPAVRSPRCVMR